MPLFHLRPASTTTNLEQNKNPGANGCKEEDDKHQGTYTNPRAQTNPMGIAVLGLRLGQYYWSVTVLDYSHETCDIVQRIKSTRNATDAG